MDENRTQENDAIRSYLKALLLHLAAQSKNPAFELQIILREVIDELHDEVKESLKKKKHLRVVNASEA